MKFLVPNYSCLQNPWLGCYHHQIPVLSVLCPQLNLLNPPPKQNSWVRHWWELQGARHPVLRCRRPCHYASFFSCNTQFSPVSGVANGAAPLFELWCWPLVMEVNHIYLSVWSPHGLQTLCCTVVRPSCNIVTFSCWSPHGLQTLCCTVVRPKLQYAAAMRISVTSCDACKLQFVSVCVHLGSQLR